MRKKGIPLCCFLSIAFLLGMFSYANATRSRLLGMGDLSIVIEDESNMINMWDFGRNPAGFLEDEKQSVIRGDFLWDTYEIREMTYYPYYNPGEFLNFKADGDQYKGWISGAYRKEEDLALGAYSNYSYHKVDSKYYGRKFKSPAMLLVFSKRLTSNTTLGADIAYREEELEYRLGSLVGTDTTKSTELVIEMGATTHLGSNVSFGAVLGYEDFNPDKNAYLPQSFTWRFSGQGVVRIAGKLALGMETVYTIERANLTWGGLDYIQIDKVIMNDDKDNYRYTSLRLRAIYDLSSKFGLGVFYFDREPFYGFYDPLFSLLSLPGYRYYVRHWGAGISYKPSENVLAGMEYHLRDSAEPSDRYFQNWGLMNESLNIGVEGRLSPSVVLRGGFVRSETNQNPNFDEQRDTWQSKITSGLSYQPKGSNIMVEFSYVYSFGKFTESWGVGNPELNQNTLSVSFKGTL